MPNTLAAWTSMALLISLIVLAVISTHWLPLVLVAVIAFGYLAYEYLQKR